MSHANEHDKPQAAAARGDHAPANVSRRRFAKAGAAVPVVLGSLASKPVLAIDSRASYHCTISGQLSGNMSSHPDKIDCKTLGCSPTTWKTKTWPAKRAGCLPNNDGSFPSNPGAGDIFNGCRASTYVLLSAFKFKSVTSGGVTSCKTYDCNQAGYANSSSHATLLQILYTGGSGDVDTELKRLGRATVASLLNAFNSPDFPLTADQVVAMFNAVYMGGTYKVNTTTTWSGAQVRAYFESLYA